MNKDEIIVKNCSNSQVGNFEPWVVTSRRKCAIIYLILFEEILSKRNKKLKILGKKKKL